MEVCRTETVTLRLLEQDLPSNTGEYHRNDHYYICTQLITIKTIFSYPCIHVLNNVIATFFDIQISPYLESNFMKTAQDYIVTRINENYTNEFIVF